MSLTRLQLIEEVVDRFERSEIFFGHGTDNAYDEAMWLIKHVLRLPLEEPLTGADKFVSENELCEIYAVVEQRITQRKPLAYLLNSAWFCGLEFYVDERVIVPRSPIAELVEQEFAPWLRSMPENILDLCTGSACIAIACATQFQQAIVHATDISIDALAVADINIGKHGMEKRVKLFQADVFEGLPETRYDLIVSNPPYVDVREMAEMPDEYRQEPEMALAAGSDGLRIVRRMLQEAELYLTDNGILVCEVGDSEDALQNAYPTVPFIWLEFEFGGHGVFLLHAEDLRKYREELSYV